MCDAANNDDGPVTAAVMCQEWMLIAGAHQRRKMRYRRTSVKNLVECQPFDDRQVLRFPVVAWQTCWDKSAWACLFIQQVIRSEAEHLGVVSIHPDDDTGDVRCAEHLHSREMQVGGPRQVTEGLIDSIVVRIAMDADDRTMVLR